MSTTLRIQRGSEYDNYRDEIEECETGRCIAVVWVRRPTAPGASARTCFKDDAEGEGFMDRMVSCTNACTGIDDPAAAIAALTTALKAARASLADWMEIAEEDDMREEDDEAIELADIALAMVARG